MPKYASHRETNRNYSTATYRTTLISEGGYGGRYKVVDNLIVDN